MTSDVHARALDAIAEQYVMAHESGDRPMTFARNVLHALTDHGLMIVGVPKDAIGRPEDPN